MDMIPNALNTFGEVFFNVHGLPDPDSGDGSFIRRHLDFAQPPYDSCRPTPNGKGLGDRAPQPIGPSLS